MVGLRVHRGTLRPQLGGHGGHPFGDVDQQVLQGGHLRLFSADPHPGAAGAAGGLLTLIAKHVGFHEKPPCFGPAVRYGALGPEYGTHSIAEVEGSVCWKTNKREVDWGNSDKIRGEFPRAVG